jgi:hypothetical protein
MSFEIESKITGELLKNSVVILNQSVQNELLSRGYGEKCENLKPCIYHILKNSEF